MVILSTEKNPVAPSVEEKKLNRDEIIRDTLKAFGISEEQSKLAKQVGLPIENMALYTGMLEIRINRLEKVANLIEPLLTQPQQSTTQPTNQPQNTSQTPSRSSQVMDIIAALRQFGVLGGSSNAADTFFMEIGKRSFIDSMSFNNVLRDKIVRDMGKEVVDAFNKEREEIAKVTEGKK